MPRAEYVGNVTVTRYLLPVFAVNHSHRLMSVTDPLMQYMIRVLVLKWRLIYILGVSPVFELSYVGRGLATG